MADLKTQHLLTLVHLLSLGARHNFVPVTTSELGRGIKKSQQAASMHLAELERGGFVEKGSGGRGISVRITAKGYSEMARISGVLRDGLGSHPSHIELEGTLVSGMGEGAYYMSLAGYTRQFRKAIGYVPFPGTLNVRVDGGHHVQTLSRLDGMDGTVIRGFSDRRRTYGWVRCFPGTVNGIGCHLIRLERTHHDHTIIELISESEIRRAGRLRDGSRVIVRIPMDG